MGNELRPTGRVMVVVKAKKVGLKSRVPLHNVQAINRTIGSTKNYAIPYEAL